MRPYPRADHLVAGAAAAVLLLTVFTVPDVSCTAGGCDPEPVMSIAAGVLAATAVMSYLHRWAAVGAAAVCAVLWPIAGRVDESQLGWRALLPLALLAAVVGVARLRWEEPLASALRRQPPAPHRLPGVGALSGVAGALLVAAGLAAMGLTLWRQDQVDAQQAAADRVTAEVLQHVDDGAAVRLRLPDGTEFDADVLAASDYPVGSRVEVLVDGAGLRQLSTEPYDITVLFLPLVPVVGGGVALLARAYGRRRMLHRLFAEPQAVHAVRVLDHGDEITVLVPGPPGSARQFNIVVVHECPPDGVDEDSHARTRVRTVPATLFGDPRAGGWCAVEVHGRIRVPTRPVAEVEIVPYDSDRGLPADIEDDGEPAVDLADLLPDDQDPSTVREHRAATLRSWAGMVVQAAAIVTVTMVSAAGTLPAMALVVLGVVNAGVACELAWRYSLRPRACWNVGGISVLTPWGQRRSAWTPDTGIEITEDGAVLLTDGETEFRIPVAAGRPVAGVARSPWQLAAALRHARRIALDTGQVGPPPRLPATPRPWPLYLIWAVISAAAIALTWLA
ncbi:hypothetical protein AB0M46_04465 [Dactylosporangium sp. NPDC051485]|uniref:hypothetical protein n=1 Tax=Dactylosporangium sp. NPDC051485 TaxID=3154846 RepID=UPI003442F0CF